MWVTRKMFREFQKKWDGRWEAIITPIVMLNKEYGKIKTSVKWLTWLTGALVLGLLGIAWALIQQALGA